MLRLHVLLQLVLLVPTCIYATAPYLWMAVVSPEFTELANWGLDDGTNKFPTPTLAIVIPNSYYLTMEVEDRLQTFNCTVTHPIPISVLKIGNLPTAPSLLLLNSTLSIQLSFVIYRPAALIIVEAGCTGGLYFIACHLMETPPMFVLQVERGGTFTIDGGLDAGNWFDLIHNGTVNINSGKMNIVITLSVLQLNGCVYMRGPDLSILNITYPSMYYNPGVIGEITVNAFNITGPAQIFMQYEADVVANFDTLVINSPSYTTYISGWTLTIGAIDIIAGHLRLATATLSAPSFSIPSGSVVYVDGTTNTSTWDIIVGFLSGSGEVQVSNSAVFSGASGITFTINTPNRVTFTGSYTNSSFSINGSVVFSVGYAPSISNVINILAGAWVTIESPMQDCIINVAAGGNLEFTSECSNCFISSAGTIFFNGNSPPTTFSMVAGYVSFSQATISAFPTPLDGTGTLVFDNVTFASTVASISASSISLTIENSIVSIPLTVTSGTLQVTGSALSSITCASSACNFEDTTLSSLSVSGSATVSSTSPLTLSQLNWEGGNLNFNGQVHGGTFAPSSVATLAGGNLQINGSVSWTSGNIVVASGATLTVSVPVTSASGTFSGAGAVVVSGGTLMCSGVSVASLSVSNGEAVFTQPVTIPGIVFYGGMINAPSVSVTHLTINGPSSSINSTLSVTSSLLVASPGSLHIGGPQFTLTGTTTVNGYLTLASSTFNCNAVITVNSGATLELDVPYVLAPPCYVSGGGTLII